jgi:hypothetical protein
MPEHQTWQSVVDIPILFRFSQNSSLTKGWSAAEEHSRVSEKNLDCARTSHFYDSLSLSSTPLWYPHSKPAPKE